MKWMISLFLILATPQATITTTKYEKWRVAWNPLATQASRIDYNLVTVVVADFEPNLNEYTLYPALDDLIALGKTDPAVDAWLKKWLKSIIDGSTTVYPAP